MLSHWPHLLSVSLLLALSIVRWLRCFVCILCVWSHSSTAVRIFTRKDINIRIRIEWEHSCSCCCIALHIFRLYYSHSHIWRYILGGWLRWHISRRHLVCEFSMSIYCDWSGRLLDQLQQNHRSTTKDFKDFTFLHPTDKIFYRHIIQHISHVQRIHMYELIWLIFVQTQHKIRKTGGKELWDFFLFFNFVQKWILFFSHKFLIKALTIDDWLAFLILRWVEKTVLKKFLKQCSRLFVIFAYRIPTYLYIISRRYVWKKAVIWPLRRLKLLFYVTCKIIKN